MAATTPTYVEVTIPAPVATSPQQQQQQDHHQRQLNDYEAFKEYIEVFLVEVYRCKLCKYNSAVKVNIAEHMKENHFPTYNQAAGNGDQREEHANAESQQQNPVHLGDLTTQQNDAVSLSNALEVLMGLGAECAADAARSAENTMSQPEGEMQHQQGQVQSQDPTVTQEQTDQDDDDDDCEAKQLQTVDTQVLKDVSSQQTTITIVQDPASAHGQLHTASGQTLILSSKHFKKSRKSDAVIPTRESLGISSPFQKKEYIGQRKFQCEKCKMRYKTRDELDKHIQKKHNRTKKFLCEICGEKLSTRASVRHHVRRKHADSKEILSCDKCDYITKFESRLKIHMGKHGSEFQCELCNRTYVSSEKLEAHYKTPMHKNAVNPIICEHCGYRTKKKDNFLVHMRKHTGEKPYKCNMCDYASADGSTLKKHVMAKHSNIRPFKCNLCSFACVDKKGLTIHMRRHTGERPFKCDMCNYAAKRRSALNVHKQTHLKQAEGMVRRAKMPGVVPSQVTIAYDDQDQAYQATTVSFPTQSNVQAHSSQIPIVHHVITQQETEQAVRQATQITHVINQDGTQVQIPSSIAQHVIAQQEAGQTVQIPTSIAQHIVAQQDGSQVQISSSIAQHVIAQQQQQQQQEGVQTVQIPTSIAQHVIAQQDGGVQSVNQAVQIPTCIAQHVITQQETDQSVRAIWQSM
ncbi:uncharacterized protein LOC102806712 [Saccoglossus kowalevskii]|uniref:Zinc finger protein 37-like n=1 Tax=Saccoglossus kowalevskii TaxID=10224 RepID=A0ABM0MHW0_SACKO|nr:PREDICTED: zinc finger protein 37-like [Saccoglossus kowalevskii]